MKKWTHLCYLENTRARAKWGCEKGDLGSYALVVAVVAAAAE